ncbi:molybdate ABC transporter permease subunit [Bacillus sp. GM2]|jgi:molybdate transport system permease protein|uniref:Molybdenum transport system permease n=1 Tax=Bacillus licheniformis (strain ATCC 14580 / DSM 13 / JCM 2505 / CCUG 7422 / NBRC 12200 / NCIMB 9375 / NCTC 10341 / NRRL NRS-1264 / Gibson 46) TaxID=279010 RepID=Q65LK1_BACLD|nr:MULTISPECIES: molybdate ABC transporter permease subunit [Bacillus]AAU22716.1 molybdate transport system permease protein [Bacillus licheniformis DSM 13 = ATCC 14580]AAU40063.1 molybdenum uptake ABC transporter permease YvgM [Bacillus licheniformis DSM 13 = ATCC 14580]AOP14292.1 Putative molybdenum transport system permease protein YvgM [Bacillus licheniformis]ARC71604.1 molybdenum transport system permease protein ModB [Bacillus licheniformis]ARC72822.1 molybdenum transport system permease
MLEEFLSPIEISIQVSAAAGIIAVLLGTAAARLLANRNFKGKSIIETVMMLPLVLPPTVVGFFLIVIFGRQSVIGRLIENVFQAPVIFTWWAAVIAAAVVAFPLMYQSAKSGFLAVDRDIEDAARVDGANEWRVFLFVTVPLASNGIMTGIVLSFARALGEFGATLMFAGIIPGVTQTVPTAIYLAIDSGNMTLAWMWVASIAIISFLMLFFVQFKQK